MLDTIDSTSTAFHNAYFGARRLEFALKVYGEREITPVHARLITKELYANSLQTITGGSGTKLAEARNFGNVHFLTARRTHLIIPFEFCGTAR